MGPVLFVTAYIGMYAIVSRRAGRTALFGGILMCVGFAMLVVFAVSNAYRMAVVFGGRLDQHGTDPLVIVAELTFPAFLVGALLLSFAVARTWALGPWSMLPLLLMFAGTVLRLVLIRSGLPVQHLPQAVGEGPVTLLIVHAPELVTNMGWVLLGWVMWRRSGEARLGRDMMPAYPSK
jgi:hypothetical protein